MKTAIGTNYKEIITNVLPSNSFELAVLDAQTFFHEEIPLNEIMDIYRNTN